MEKSDSYTWISDPQAVGVNVMALGMWVEVLNRWLGPAKNVTAIGKNHIKQLRNKDGEWEAPTVPDSLAVAAALDCGATA